MLQLLQTLARGFVLLFLQCFAFHLQLDQATVETIHLFRLGVHLHADARGGFVDQVDRLVRQLAVGDVTLTQLGGSDDRGVGDIDAVVHFVALLEATQDGDGVLFGRLIDNHLLEAAFQRGVLFHILTILVQRGGTDTVQLATRQRGLEHVARIHGAFALAGADHGVQLVDEQDDLAFLFRQFVQYRFQALFKLATELGTGNQRSHIQRQHFLALEPFGHFAVDDALRQPFNDGGLAHTGLTDQHRVVLGAALQHLNSTANLVITTDHRVQLAGLGALSQVDAVFVQRLTGLFRVGIVHAVASPHVIDSVFQ